MRRSPSPRAAPQAPPLTLHEHRAADTEGNARARRLGLRAIAVLPPRALHAPAPRSPSRDDRHDRRAYDRGLIEAVADGKPDNTRRPDACGCSQSGNKRPMPHKYRARAEKSDSGDHLRRHTRHVGGGSVYLGNIDPEHRAHRRTERHEDVRAKPRRLPSMLPLRSDHPAEEHRQSEPEANRCGIKLRKIPVYLPHINIPRKNHGSGIATAAPVSVY